MITETEMINGLQIVGGFIAIGAVFDTVTKSFRQKELRPQDPATFQRVAAAVYGVVYEKLLPKKLGSWHAAPRVFLFSLLTILLACVLLEIFDEGAFFNYLRGLLIPMPPLSFMIPLILGFTGITWFTLGQTKLFMEEALNSTQAVRRFVFAISDVFVSSNLFTFLFTFVVWVSTMSLAFIDLRPIQLNTDASVHVVIGKVDLPDGSDQLLEYSDEDNFGYVVKVLARVDGEVYERIRPISRFVIHSTEPFLEPEMFAPANLNLSSEPTFGISRHHGDQDLMDLTHDGIAKIVSQNMRIQYFGTFPLEPEPHPGSQVTYKSIFSKVDDLEDNLFDLYRTIAFPFYIPAGFVGGYNPFDRHELCLSVIDSRIIRGDINAAKDCTNRSIVLSGARSNWTNYWSVSFLDRASFPVLVSPLFLAAMIPTLLFYFAIFSALVFRQARYFATKSKVANAVYTTIPFTFSGLGFGVVAWLLVSF